MTFDTLLLRRSEDVDSFSMTVNTVRHHSLLKNVGFVTSCLGDLWPLGIISCMTPFTNHVLNIRRRGDFLRVFSKDLINVGKALLEICFMADMAIDGHVNAFLPRVICELHDVARCTELGVVLSVVVDK
jgi:hypothetical protein